MTAIRPDRCSLHCLAGLRQRLRLRLNWVMAMPVLPVKSTEDWSRDGRFLLYSERKPDSHPFADWDAMALPLVGDRTPIPLMQTQAVELSPRISPDGRWLAYWASSGDVNNRDVYVQAFPGADDSPQRRWNISNNGVSSSPRWRDDGKELFYQTHDGDLMAATIEIGLEGIRAGTPRRLLSGVLQERGEMQFDIAPEGVRLLVILPDKERQLTVVRNFQATLGE